VRLERSSAVICPLLPVPYPCEPCAFHRRQYKGLEFTLLSRAPLSFPYLLGMSPTKKLLEPVFFLSCQDGDNKGEAQVLRCEILLVLTQQLDGPPHAEIPGVGIVMDVRIINTGPPSIAKDFRLFVTPSGSPEGYEAKPYTTGEKPLEVADLRILPTQLLFIKTRTPIERGGLKRGYLLFFLEHVKDSELGSGTKFELAFKDAADKEYRCIDTRSAISYESLEDMRRDRISGPITGTERKEEK